MDGQWIGFLAAATLLLLYLRHVNRGLSSVPPEVHALSPARFDKAAIIANLERLSKHPITIDLPPRTGRRYIVVGGAGFLPGWIVVHLIARGEDPRRIRIVDIRAPTRRDLLAGPASEVAFYQTDVSNAEAVLTAFTAPWPDADYPDSPITVFHSASNIRFWERAKRFLSMSTRVNVNGTQNIIAASRAVGASVLVYTSSASVAVRQTRFWLWPWQRYPKDFFQVLDDETPFPSIHTGYFSNYAASKAKAEQLVRKADKTPLPCGGVLRTGCIRPGNGIFGPGGDILAELCLVRKENYTWIPNITQSFVYVENCSLAHLLYEQRLLETTADPHSGNPDIGGQAFNITDPNPPITFGDLYSVLTLSPPTKFYPLPPVMMLALAHIIEAYYVLRVIHPLISQILPPIKGEISSLQPSVFSLTQVHLVFDDSRARKTPKEGGLGYNAPFRSLDGLCKLVIEWQAERSEQRKSYWEQKN